MAVKKPCRRGAHPGSKADVLVRYLNKRLGKGPLLWGEQKQIAYGHGVNPSYVSQIAGELIDQRVREGRWP